MTDTRRQLSLPECAPAASSSNSSSVSSSVSADSDDSDSGRMSDDLLTHNCTNQVAATDDVKHEDETPSVESLQSIERAGQAASMLNASLNMLYSARASLEEYTALTRIPVPFNVVMKLDRCFHAHIADPTLSKQEVAELAAAVNLPVLYIRNWFANTRKVRQHCKHVSHCDALLLTFVCTVLFSPALLRAVLTATSRLELSVGHRSSRYMSMYRSADSCS